MRAEDASPPAPPAEMWGASTAQLRPKQYASSGSAEGASQLNSPYAEDAGGGLQASRSSSEMVRHVVAGTDDVTLSAGIPPASQSLDRLSTATTPFALVARPATRVS